jgi:hypothetical protein
VIKFNEKVFLVTFIAFIYVNEIIKRPIFDGFKEANEATIVRKHGWLLNRHMAEVIYSVN